MELTLYDGENFNSSLIVVIDNRRKRNIPKRDNSKRKRQIDLKDRATRIIAKYSELSIHGNFHAENTFARVPRLKIA